MLIEYYLADGQEIKYDTSDQGITLEAIDWLALKYAELCPNKLPTYVYMNVRAYAELASTMLNASRVQVAQTLSPGGNHVIQIWSSVGLLNVRIMPWAFDYFTVLVGRPEDYDNYDIDKIFEETVLKDCERGT